jgi:hypothetical protein
MAAVAISLEIDCAASLLDARSGIILRLDKDELVASGVEDGDPAAAEHARRALEELERLADQGFPLLRTVAHRSDRGVEE